jgi:AraC-like DNA-binding protein
MNSEPTQMTTKPLRADQEAAWLCKASNAFQRVMLVAGTRPVETLELKRELSKLPTPVTPFERLASRCLMCECMLALVGGDASYRALRTLRDFVRLTAAGRFSSDSLARFSKSIIELCQSPSQHSQLAEEIGSRLEQEYASKMTLDAMAREYRVSRLHLDRTFHHRFGIHFHEYLRAIRVERGLDLVREGMKIEAAAPAVGYKSKKNFYRAVRQVTGLTPGQVRRRDIEPNMAQVCDRANDSERLAKKEPFSH